MSIIENALKRVRVSSTPLEEPGSEIPTHSESRQSPSDVTKPPKPLASTEIANLDFSALRNSGAIAAEDVATLHAGQYRNIRRALLDNIPRAAAGAGNPRLIAVTSATAGEGKTYTSLNLALSLAREPDFQVILVDADLPKRRLSSVLGLSGRDGLAECLVNGVDVRGLLLATNVARLSLLPAGQLHRDAAELLGGSRFEKIFRDLLHSHPNLVVLMDGGPLLQSAEAEMVMRNSGQVLLVVRFGYTTKESVKEALDRIGKSKVTSLALNAWEPLLFDNQADYFQYYGTDN